MHEGRFEGILESQSRVQEEDARWFFQQLMVGLDYCHRMGVVNRDIKLENTLLDASPKPLVKITDFGYCKASNDSLPKSKVGTPGYTGGLANPGTVHPICPVKYVYSCMPAHSHHTCHQLHLPCQGHLLMTEHTTCWATAACVAAVLQVKCFL